MKKHTDIKIIDGDRFVDTNVPQICYKCDAVIEPETPRLNIASIKACDETEASLSWCTLCEACSLVVVEFFRKDCEDVSEDICTCESCGCTGNEECGAEPVDDVDFCTLNHSLICPCCRKLGKDANMARWRRKGQK